MQTLLDVLGGAFCATLLLWLLTLTREKHHGALEPKTNEQRYLEWNTRYAEELKRQRIQRVQRQLRNSRRLYGDYDAHSVVHIPAALPAEASSECPDCAE